MPADDDTTRNRVQRGYDALAARADDLDGTESPWGDSHFQRDYAWPAAVSALPDPQGRRVLLAGCGRGDHVPWFDGRGATVVGVDASGTAVRHARRRFGEVATFHRGDLTDGLGFADDGAFDLVVSNLVLSHVADWTPVLEAFHRVLEPGGTAVVTTIHPGYLRTKGDVDDDAVTELSNDWPGVELPTFYRPMDAVTTPFAEAGFRLETADEPEPPAAFAEHHPERYRAALEQPELVVIRATAERDSDDPSGG